jgi:hypothetical protein
VIHLKREHTKLPKEEKGVASTITTCIVGTPERVPLSHKKPGKKRRIQLRKRAAVAERAKETEAEKRNRRNREKKIKRRQKARDLMAPRWRLMAKSPGRRVISSLVCEFARRSCLSIGLGYDTDDTHFFSMD